MRVATLSALVVAIFLPWLGVYDLDSMAWRVVRVEALNVVDSLALIERIPYPRIAWAWRPLALVSVALYVASLATSTASLWRWRAGYLGGGLALASAALWTSVPILSIGAVAMPMIVAGYHPNTQFTGPHTHPTSAYTSQPYPA